MMANVVVDVTREQALAILKAVNIPLDAEMDDEALRGKLMAMEQAPDDLGDENLNNVVDAIFSADNVHIVAGTEEKAAAPAKKKHVVAKNGKKVVIGKPKTTTPPAPQASEPATGSKKNKATKAKKTASGSKKNKATKAKKTASGAVDRSKVGILDTIKALLTKKGYTRDELVDALVEKFPDRPREGMRVTVYSQVPKRLIDRAHLNVVKGKDMKYRILK